MHEVGLMREALDIVLDQAGRAGATHIQRIGMKVGAVSGVAPEALLFAFDALTPHTMAEGACLDIHAVPAACHCPACDASFEPDGPFFDCPCCGRLQTHVLSGRELEISFVDFT